MKFFYLLSCCFAVLSSLDDGDEEDWSKERRELIEKAQNSHNEEAIEDLGLIVAGLGEKLEKRSAARKEIYREAEQALLEKENAVPYFSDKIKEITEEEIDPTGKRFRDTRDHYYNVLSHLHSPESVRALGEFLFDERSPWNPADFIDTGGPYANSLHAADALYKLGIDHSPINRAYSSCREDLRTWQLWYGQVRAGTRTFSFKGRPEVYSLADPDRARADRIPLNAHSGAAQAASSTRDSNSENGRPNWGWWALGFAGAGGITFAAMRKRLSSR